LPDTVPVAAASRTKKKVTPFFAVAAAGTTLLAVAGLLWYYLVLMPGSANAPALPTLPKFQQDTPSHETTKNARSANSGRVVASDGPSPIAGPAPDVNSATVVLRGLLPDDTVYVNDKREPRAADAAGLVMAPGRKRFAIHRKSGTSVTRELELLPYERQIIDIKKETAHDPAIAK
jgi:hypothetical protein